MFNWIRKLCVKKTALPEIKSIYHEELQKLSELNVDERVYLESDRIAVLFGSVEEYNIWLERLLHALHEDIVFPARIFQAMLVCRCNFYRNMKGEPTRVQYIHQLFVELATKVLKRHEAVMLMEARSPMLEASIYRSQALIFNLCSLIKAL